MPSVVSDINKMISRVDPTRRPYDDDEPIVKGANSILTFLQNIRKQPVPLQIGVGGSAGVKREKRSRLLGDMMGEEVVRKRELTQDTSQLWE
uniref:WH2 domain-containing protein n=1 Tax=Ascaris lumbricoides TaxID=6252 RepID=A0A0M3I5F9_ASCLU